MLFIQMSGAPGAGKTTMARAIAQEIGAAIIDHDVTKTALLSADVSASLAGKASYEVLYALAAHLLDQGQSVIFDSLCFYEALLARGQAIAEEASARYLYIECVVDDLAALDKRLRLRARRPGQVGGIGDAAEVAVDETIRETAVFQNWIANMKRPLSPYLTLDTQRPVDSCLAEALAYIQEGQGSKA